MGKRLDAYLEAVERKKNPYENYKYAEGPQYAKEKELYDKWEAENNADYHKEQRDIREKADAPRREKMKQNADKAQAIVDKYASEVPDMLKQSGGTKISQDDYKQELSKATNDAINVVEKIVDEIKQIGMSDSEIDSFLRGIHSKLGIKMNGYKIAQAALSQAGK